MTKKFFSIFLLATSMVASVLSAAPLRIINGSVGEVSDVKLVFNGQDEINTRFLQPDQSSTSDFPDNIVSVKIYTVTYIDATGTQVTENFNGKTFYLPADLTLGNASESTITITQNDEARKAAEEAEILNQIATKAKSAKDQVVQSATAAKDWIVSKTKTAPDQTEEAIVEVATVIQDESKELADTAQESVSEAVHTADEILS